MSRTMVKSVCNELSKHNNTISRLDYLKNYCFENGYFYTYTPDIFMITKGKDSNTKYILTGTIFDLSNGRVLVYLHKKLVLTTKPYEKEDTIYKLNDGTIVSLYYKNGWHIATINGYDVSSFYWFGNKTYSELLFELISKYKLEVNITDNVLDFPTLNKEYCYTIGFTHKDFHPHTTTESVWNISVSNNYTSVNELLPFDECNVLGESAYGSYSIKGNIMYVRETPLMVYLKDNIYNYNMNLFIKDKNKLNYVILSNIIKSIKYNNTTFTELLPSTLALSERYKTFINLVIDNIVNYNVKGELLRAYCKKIKDLLLIFVYNIKYTDKSIILNLVNDICYVEVYYNLINYLF